MKLKHDFKADFELLTDLYQEPFAVSRFGDGEAAILLGEDIPTADGWTVPAKESRFTELLRDSLEFDHPRLVQGLCSPSIDDYARYREYLMSVSNTPDERITSSNIFVNANWGNLIAKAGSDNWLRNCTLVLSEDCKAIANTIKERGLIAYVPRHAVNHPSIDTLVFDILTQILPSRQPILFSAGPLSNILIHQYWEQAKEPKTCLDIGSALDPYLKRQTTRGYHKFDHPNRKKECVWTTK